MDDEFQSHLATSAPTTSSGAGSPREAAERAARVEFGGVEAQKEAARDARGLRLWDELRANVAFAARGIGHHPIQSLIVVTTLTLGIGISARRVLGDERAGVPCARRSRPGVVHADLRSRIAPTRRGPSFPGPVPLGDYLAYARTMRSLSSVAGWQHVQLAAVRRRAADARRARHVQLLRRLRTGAADRGTHAAADDCESRAPVAVIGSELWRSAFGADSGAVGRVLRINGQTIRIVGVAPTFSSASTDDQLWLPYTLREPLHLGAERSRRRQTRCGCSSTADSRRARRAATCRRSAGHRRAAGSIDRRAATRARRSSPTARSSRSRATVSSSAASSPSSSSGWRVSRSSRARASCRSCSPSPTAAAPRWRCAWRSAPARRVSRRCSARSRWCWRRWPASSRRR